MKELLLCKVKGTKYFMSSENWSIFSRNMSTDYNKVVLELSLKEVINVLISQDGEYH